MRCMDFLNIMFKILDEEKPDYLTVAFDRSEPTFRHQMFDAYKGTRKPMPQELHEQVPGDEGSADSDGRADSYQGGV